MTRRQLELCDFIRTYTQIHRITPTLREMQKFMKFKSISNVHIMLRRLRDQGEVTFTPRQARSVKVVD